MKERPIIFSGPMVRAILDGRKTQTRRVAKCFSPLDRPDVLERVASKCPYGRPGDKLWVRETFNPHYFRARSPAYRADWNTLASDVVPEPQWTPSIYMPRWASRITLEVTRVWVERLNEICTEDIIAEGLSTELSGDAAVCDLLDKWQTLWDSIARRGRKWADNPWVWAIEFSKLEED